MHDTGMNLWLAGENWRQRVDYGDGSWTAHLCAKNCCGDWGVHGWTQV